jgi:histidinol-phosphate phosphatase family protein
MQAVIMAGGKGTRLAALTKDEIPKPMIPIMGRPLLEWQIEQLRNNDITDVIMVIGHLGDNIKEHFGDGKAYGINVKYVEEREPLGTAGAFYFLKELLKEQYFLLVFGDVFFDIDIARMESYHRQREAVATLFVHPNDHPFDSDLVTLYRDGRVENLDSKHNVRDYWYDNCVNAGFYILNREICESVTKPQKTDLEKDILCPLIMDNGAVYGYHSPEYIKDVGTVERIEKTIGDIENGFIANKCLKKKQRCIFLDRDGTINQHLGLVYKEEDFILEGCATEAIRRINESGRLGIVITNQPVVARGLCDVNDVENIHKKLSTLLGKVGVYLDDIIYCPHHPDKGYPEENPLYKIQCECRKPKIGMISEAVKRYNIDLNDAWIIGDTTMDIQTGKNAGIKTALVMTGEGGKDRKYDVQPDLVCENLLEAINKILED